MKRWWIGLLGVVVPIFVWSLAVLAQPFVRLSPITCSDGTPAAVTAVSLTYGAAADKLLVTGAASKRVYLYQYVLASDTAGVTITFRSATTGGGVTCPTAAANITGVLLTYSAGGQTADSGQLLVPLTTPSGADLCLRASAASVISGYVLSCTQ